MLEEHAETYAPTAIPATASRLASGRYLDLAAPRAADLAPADALRGMSFMPRFSGQCEPFLSVAEHSLHVAERMMRLHGSAKGARCGLWHDAAEGLTGGDLPTPYKVALGARRVKAAEGRVLAAVLRALRLGPHWPVWSGHVAAADRHETHTEALLYGMDGVDGVRRWVPADHVCDRSLRHHIGDPARVRVRFEAVDAALARGENPWK